ncbi:MAG: hypothetical protein Kapaf2KO_21930 [Candidatus Kapaibacteriales bacterium]
MALPLIASAADRNIEFTSPVDGTKLAGTLSISDDCVDCPLVVIANYDEDADGSLVLPFEELNDCYFPNMEGEINRFSSIATVLESNGVAMLRYSARAEAGGSNTEAAELTPMFYAEDLKASIEAGKMESGVGQGDVGIITTLESHFLLTKDVLDAGVNKIMMLTPFQGRADSIFGNEVHDYFAECENLKQPAVFFRSEILRVMDSIYTIDTDSNSPMSEDEQSFLFNEYPKYWRTKMDMSLQAPINISESDASVYIIGSTNDQLVKPRNTTRLVNRLNELGKKPKVLEIANLNSGLTITPNLNLSSELLIEAIEYFAPPGSVSIEDRDMFIEYENSFELKTIGSGKGQLRIIDLAGRVISQSNDNSIEKPNNSGFYLLVYSEGSGQTRHHRFIVD